MSAELAREHFLAALAALEAGDFLRARSDLHAALAILPGRLSILVNLAATELKLGEPAAAERHARAALVQDIRASAAWLNLAQSLLAQDDHAGALAASTALLALEPAHIEGQLAHALALAGLAREDEALAVLDAVLSAAPDELDAWRQKAAILRERGLHEAALAAAQEATRRHPARGEAWVALGNGLQAQQRAAEALDAFAHALRIAPDSAAWLGRASALESLRQTDAALSACDAAIALDARSAEAWMNRSHLLFRMKRIGEAVEAIARARALRPAASDLLLMHLHLKQNACDWQDFEADCATVREAVRAGRPVCDAFSFLALPASAAEQLQCARRYARQVMPRIVRDRTRPAPGKRLRIGYFSADFHNHATAWLMARVFELHDRARFEVSAFSFGPRTGDAMQTRLRAAFEHFHEVHALSDAEVAALARRHGLDIAVDLKGYTADARPGIFGHGAAPIQVNHLGYPGSLGCAAYDYLIADAVVIPPGADAQADEAVIRLPRCYQPNDNRREVAARTPSRAELGLPEDGFVFCCFNNNYKITPDVFAIWMSLLRDVAGSVLWLLGDNDEAQRNLRAAAAAAGVAPARLVFAARTPLPEHLARQRQADLFLDTFHYTAHTTASDALWIGLPVLSCAGASFPARVAASLLNAVGMDELVTDSPAAYAALARTLALDPARLAALRARLAARIADAPLFDSVAFTHAMEDALVAMHARMQQGLGPVALDIRAR